MGTKPTQWAWKLFSAEAEAPPFEFLIYWGVDGVPVVEIMTERLECNPDDSPVCRVYLNDEVLYVNPDLPEMNDE